jgi:hypothetical protein
MCWIIFIDESLRDANHKRKLQQRQQLSDCRGWCPEYQIEITWESCKMRKEWNFWQYLDLVGVCWGELADGGFQHLIMSMMWWSRIWHLLKGLLPSGSASVASSSIFFTDGSKGGVAIGFGVYHSGGPELNHFFVLVECLLQRCKQFLWLDSDKGSPSW